MKLSGTISLEQNANKVVRIVGRVFPFTAYSAIYMYGDSGFFKS